MNDSISSPRADRTQLLQIIVGLTEGIIIINPDQTIAWANKAALAMHGIASIEEFGSTVSEYRSRLNYATATGISCRRVLLEPR